MCASFLLKGSDDGAVYGRSMEFGIPIGSQLMIGPRGYPFKGIGVDGKAGTGLNWTSKLNEPTLYDGYSYLCPYFEG